MTHDEIIAVITAHRDGQKIQFSSRPCVWHDLTCPSHLIRWNFTDYTYRIKPKPKEIWVNEYKNHDTRYAYNSKEVAERESNCIEVNLVSKAVHYREVIE